MSYARILVLLGLCLGCSPAHVKKEPTIVRVEEPSPPPALEPVRVGMYIEAWKRGARSGSVASTEVQQGQVLHSGDRISVHVKVDEPAYVYVFYVDSKKAVKLLYAPAGDTKLPPDEWMRIPPLPGSLRLDKETGEESLLVVASRTKPQSVEVVQNKVQAEIGPILVRPNATAAPAMTPRWTATARPKIAPPSPDEPDQQPTMGLVLDPGMEMKVNSKESISIFRFKFLHR